jgi:hypothetical protein
MWEDFLASVSPKVEAKILLWKRASEFSPSQGQTRPRRWSIRPIGWDMPPAWDALAGDYHASEAGSGCTRTPPIIAPLQSGCWAGTPTRKRWLAPLPLGRSMTSKWRSSQAWRPLQRCATPRVRVICSNSSVIPLSDRRYQLAMSEAAIM